MPRIREGRGQADLRRGRAGTSPQHRTKSYIRHMAESRISDDRALKVAGAYPGRPVACPYIKDWANRKGSRTRNGSQQPVRPKLYRAKAEGHIKSEETSPDSSREASPR
jgi:hypothetical protein